MGCPKEQCIADLPTEQVHPSPPPSHTLELMSLVPSIQNKVKSYSLLFTCLISRAILQEMLDLTNDTFLNTLRCFIAIRDRSSLTKVQTSATTINDPNGVKSLIPNHLINMKVSTSLPLTGKFISEDLYPRKRWRRVQYLTEQYWNRWRKEYLSNISLRKMVYSQKKCLSGKCNCQGRQCI